MVKWVFWKTGKRIFVAKIIVKILLEFFYEKVFLPCLRALVPTDRSLCSSSSFPFQLFTYIKKGAQAGFQSLPTLLFFWIHWAREFFGWLCEMFYRRLALFFFTPRWHIRKLENLLQLDLYRAKSLHGQKLRKSEKSNTVGNLEFCLAFALFWTKQRWFNFSKMKQEFVLSNSLFNVNRKLCC